jgi:uncharacterized RDD family membrane protein YckC
MIYFWKINRLKFELLETPPSGMQIFAYLICILTVQAASWGFTYITKDAPNIWEHLDAALFAVFLILGTIYCYHANGGMKGKDFLSRYLSLTWVFGVRYSIMVMIPLGMILYMSLHLFSEIPDKIQWYDVLFNAVIRMPFYFFLSRHIADVALNRVSPDGEDLESDDEYAEDFDPSKYPTILRRYMSTLIDILFVLSIIIAVIYSFQGNGEVESMIRIALILASIFFYEPIFTSRFCTLGQRITGIRVRKLDSTTKISLPYAFMRTIVKLLIGFISFFYIPVTRKRRGLHDFVAGSLVVYAEME